MISLILFIAAAAVVFIGEVLTGDFAHVAWSLFLAYLGLAARGVNLP